MSLPRYCNGYQGNRGHAASLLFRMAGEINRALERETRLETDLPRKR